MKIFVVTLFFLVASLTAFAQKPDDVLATTSTRTIKLSDLREATITAVSMTPTRLAATRKAIFGKMLTQRLLGLEAKSLGVSTDKLLADQKAKVPAPPESEIKAVYAANRAALGDLTLEQARKRLISFLRSEPEQKILDSLLTRLKAKYKVTDGKNVNAVGLSDAGIIATVNSQPITSKDFEESARIELFELKASLADLIMADLKNTIYQLLITDEAKSLDIEPAALIAREVTDKMKDFSDEERIGLEDGLEKKLYSKYKVEILYKLPEPLVQTISVDDDPSAGSATAPVTIVMFSDFQCSACSLTHPLLKKAMAMFPGKIRFVVRDFPLESIHENGFRAALAANAANAQGKFFEYTETLYTHQDTLDDASLKKYAADLGLNAKQFELDFNSEKTSAEVRKDMADGEAYGIDSTPTIFINGAKTRDLSVEGFKAAIERALKQ